MAGCAADGLSTLGFAAPPLQQGDSFSTLGFALRLAEDITEVLDEKLTKKVYQICKKYGKTVDLEELDGDIISGVKVTPPYPISEKMLSDDVLVRGDAMIYIPALNLGTTPEPFMIVHLDGMEWIMVKIWRIWTFQEIGLYGAAIRKSGKSDRTPSTGMTRLDKKFLPKMKKLIARFGIEATFHVWTAGTYDPAQMKFIGYAEEEKKAPVVPVSEGDDYVEPGELTHRGKLKVFLAAQDLDWTPTEGQSVDLAGFPWILEAEKPLYSGERICLYELTIVR
jgi:hypothetical protein